MAFTLPRLPIGTVTPEQLQIWWQQVVEAIEAQEDAQNVAIAAIEAAQEAAAAANTAAASANAAAATAQSTATGIVASSALSSSYVTGVTISAVDAGTDVTIAVSAHTRHYPQPDGSTVDVAVDAGFLTGQDYSTGYYIYYDDPSRSGGAVAYHSTTDASVAAQIGDRHTVGSVITPELGGADLTGDYTQPPGIGAIKGSGF